MPRIFWFVWVGALLNRLGGFVVPFLALYLTGERGFSPGEAGFIVTLYGAGAIAAGPIGGWLADRYGRRFTMALGLALGAASMLQLGYARLPAHIGWAAFQLGLCGDLYRPGVAAFVADAVPTPADRTRAFSLLYWAVNIGFAVATLLGGLLAKRGYLRLFWADAITTLAFAALVLWKVPETRPRLDRPATPAGPAPSPGPAGSAGGEGGWRNLAVPLGDRVFVAFTLLNLVVQTVFLQGTVALPLDMRDHGIDTTTYGALMAINGILIVALQPYAGHLSERLTVTQVLVVGVLLTGLGYGANALGGSWPLYAVAIAIWTLGEIALAPVGLSVVSAIAPPSLRGSYMGVYQISWGASQLIAPALGGRVLAGAGARTLWIGCFVATVAVAAGHLLLDRPRRRRLEAGAEGEGPARPAPAGPG